MALASLAPSRDANLVTLVGPVIHIDSHRNLYSLFLHLSTVVQGSESVLPYAAALPPALPLYEHHVQGFHQVCLLLDAPHHSNV